VWHSDSRCDESHAPGADDNPVTLQRRLKSRQKQDEEKFAAPESRLIHPREAQQRIRIAGGSKSKLCVTC
jgi:hypothetical protein